MKRGNLRRGWLKTLISETSYVKLGGLILISGNSILEFTNFALLHVAKGLFISKADLGVLT